MTATTTRHTASKTFPAARPRRKPRVWNGKTIGRQILLDCFERYRRFMADGTEYEPDRTDLLTHECFQDPKEKLDFYKYIQMNNWLEKNRDRCEAHMQECQVHFTAITSYLSIIVNSEEMLRYVEKTKMHLETGDEDLRNVEDFFEQGEPCVLRDGIEEALPQQDKIRHFYNVFGRSYYFVSGYNYALERIAVIHNLPEVMAYKRPIHYLDEEIKIINARIDALEARLAYTPYPRPDLLAMKRKNLRSVFPHIRAEEITAPRKESEKQIDRLIRSFAGFGDPITGRGPDSDRLMVFLLCRPRTVHPTDGELQHGR